MSESNRDGGLAGARGDKPLRGAIVGCGYFSDFHFDAWRRIDGVEIVAVCDPNPERVSDRADTYGIGNVYHDVRAMLDRESALDFVDIVTRPDTHHQIVSAVAESGIDMICQKPLAPSRREAAEIVELARCHQVRLMIHENFRFQPWYREAKTLMQSGVIGTKLHTITFRNRAGDGHGPDAYLARQPYFQTMERFLIFEAGVHTVDTFRYLAGEIDSVWCVTRKLNPVIAGEDAATAMFRFHDGGMGVYDANRFNESTAENPRFTFGTLWIEGDGGTIRLSDDGSLHIHPLGDREHPHHYDLSRHGFAGDCVHATQSHFADRLRDGRPFETSGEDYLRTIDVTEAMYASAQSGGWESP